MNLKAHGLSKAPHLGHPRSPSSPSDEAPPGKGRNAQTSPRRDTVALRGLSQPAEVRGRPGFYTLGDGGSPPGSWSLALPQHSPTPLSLVLAYPGGADSLGALTVWGPPACSPPCSPAGQTQGPQRARSHSLVRQQVAAGAQLRTRAQGWPPAPSLPHSPPLPQLSSFNC